jgi:hypothetical protein
MANRRSSTPDGDAEVGQTALGLRDRWSLLVLREAMFGNRRHLRILQERSNEASAPNILADRRAAVPPSGTSTAAVVTDTALRDPVALKGRLGTQGQPHAYPGPFPGEGHGFRKAENIRAALDGELLFYAQVWGFDLPADEGITPIEVMRPDATGEGNQPYSLGRRLLSVPLAAADLACH